MTRKAEAGESRTRRLIRSRSWGVCEACGKRPASDAAHRIGRGVGGPWSPSNILDLCRGCHRAHHENPEKAYAEGYHLQSHQVPADVPVVLVLAGVRQSVLLDDQGGFSPTS